MAPIIRVFGVQPQATQAYSVPITAACNSPQGQAVLQAVTSAGTTTGAAIIQQGRSQGDGIDTYYATVRSGAIAPGTIQLRITVACSS